jgi:hypothetical protein
MPLAVYRELTNRMPVGALWDEIIATVTDETQWRRSIMAVLARGWNPTNVDNLLMIYRAGGKIADRGKGGRASVSYAPTDSVPADEIAALEQLEAARGRGEDIPVESWEVDARLRRGYQRWHDERAGRDTHRVVD